MDATSSMTRLLQSTKDTIQQMFERANAVLREHNCSVKFYIQLVAFRNYRGGPGQLLQKSTSELNHYKLVEFMNDVKASGGSSTGEAAIEVALAHVNFLQ
jgi:hypothetical protein